MKQQNEDLKEYRLYGLTLVQLMFVLGLVGIILFAILKLFLR